MSGYNDGVRAAAEWYREKGWLLDEDAVPDAMQSALLRPEAEAPAPEPVAWRVKPLEWEHLGGASYRAKAPLFGSLRVEHYTSSGWQVNWSAPGICDTFVHGKFASAEDAKAAAQAEYEARILSALHPATTCTAVGPMSACPNREPLLRTAALTEKG